MTRPIRHVSAIIISVIVTAPNRLAVRLPKNGDIALATGWSVLIVRLFGDGMPLRCFVEFLRPCTAPL